MFYQNNPLVCSHCKSENVRIRCWVDPNTNIIDPDDHDNRHYCNECEKDVALIEGSRAIAGGA